MSGTFFGTYRKEWNLPAGKIEFTFYHKTQRLQCLVHSSKSIYPVPLMSLEGIPKEILDQPSKIIAFLKDVSVNLTPCSDGSYRVYLSSNLFKEVNAIDPEATPELLWINGIVPYRIDPSLPSTAKIKVQTAIVEWKTAGIGFVFKEDEKKEAKDYILFSWPGANPHCMPKKSDIKKIKAEEKKETPYSVCAPAAGRQGGKQVIHCDVEKVSIGSLLHEIGHAIGLYGITSGRNIPLSTEVKKSAGYLAARAIDAHYLIQAAKNLVAITRAGGADRIEEAKDFLDAAQRSTRSNMLSKKNILILSLEQRDAIILANPSDPKRISLEQNINKATADFQLSEFMLWSIIEIQNEIDALTRQYSSDKAQNLLFLIDHGSAASQDKLYAMLKVFVDSLKLQTPFSRGTSLKMGF